MRIFISQIEPKLILFRAPSHQFYRSRIISDVGMMISMSFQHSIMYSGHNWDDSTSIETPPNADRMDRKFWITIFHDGFQIESRLFSNV